MAEEKVEVIIVGGGLSGLTAACVLARAGTEVLLIERGTYCGAKNVTGGKLYSHSIEKVFPKFAASAPVERRIVREEVFSLSNDSIRPIDVGGVGKPEDGSAAYSVLRAKLDAWLGEQTENEGVMLIQNICVSELLVEDKRVCGVVAGDEVMRADVVILADGANTLLAQGVGLCQELSPSDTCVGVKEVLSLREAVIEERFGLQSGEGVEQMYMGDRSQGQYADGFLYTNRDSISIGIEFVISDIDRTSKSVPELLDEFKARPEIAALIEGGALTEYSAHLVHHGGGVPEKLYSDGVLLVGDAAGLVANYGFTVRGMDLAVESGRLAAETVLDARMKNDFSAASLAAYQDAVEDSFIAREMRKCEQYFAQRAEGV